jgi:MoaA/NifB/PqqE/SkfB family radical SAM enzyme
MIKALDNDQVKSICSDCYNTFFRKSDGLFLRWGETKDDDPQQAPYPEILDCEISTVVANELKDMLSIEYPDWIFTPGSCQGGCPFCYKSNHRHGVSVHMPVHIMERILDTFEIHNGEGETFQPLTQIALGITDVEAHPQLFEIAQAIRKRGIACNVTINGRPLTDEYAKQISQNFNAIAVSVTEKNQASAFEVIHKLSVERGMKQVNIHFVLSESNYDYAFNLIDKVADNPLLEKVNAIVFLSAKDKTGCGIKFVNSLAKYRKLMGHAKEKQVGIGMDSCDSPSYLEMIKDDEDYEQQAQYVEPCESGLFSSYINTFGFFFPCSFTEGALGWDQGMDVLAHDHFTEIWRSDKLNQWRDTLLGNNRNCPVYNISFGE